jgi:hypothetical protein
MIRLGLHLGCDVHCWAEKLVATLKDADAGAIQD